MEDTKNLYTTQDTAEAANFSKQTVLNYVKNGVITPVMHLANGQCYFDESTVVTLMTLSCAKDYKDNTLAVCFGNEEECRAFEEEYNGYLNKHGIQRVDNLTEYLMKCREVPKSNKLHRRLCMIESVDKTIRACDNEIKELSDELLTRMLTSSSIEDARLIVGYKNELVERNKEIKEQMDEHDRKIFNNELRRYVLRKDKIEKRYAIVDMKRLAKDLACLPRDEMIEYEPEKPAVKSIWRRVEQKYLRNYTKDYMRECLAKGYVAVFCMDGLENGGIYQLLSKAMNPCIRRIEIYCTGDVTNEIQQVIKFLQDTKDVTFKSEI